MTTILLALQAGITGKITHTATINTIKDFMREQQKQNYLRVDVQNIFRYDCGIMFVLALSVLITKRKLIINEASDGLKKKDVP
jgi:hypothetical protein